MSAPASRPLHQPGLRIAAPRDATRIGELLNEAVDDADGPTVLRYSKGQTGEEADAAGKLGGMDILRFPPPDLAADVLVIGARPMALTRLQAEDRLAGQGIGGTADARARPGALRAR